MSKRSICLAIATLTLPILAFSALATGAGAQERTLTISPRTAGGSGSSYTFTDRAGTWDRVSAVELNARGPHYPEASGVSIRRGRLIPNTVDTAMMRNASIRGLKRGVYYGYFSTDDARTVIVNASTRRVARVMLVHGALPARLATTTSGPPLVTQASYTGGYPANYAYGYGYGYGYPYAGLGLGAGYYDGGYYGGGYYGGGYYGRPGIGRPGIGRPGVGLRPRVTPYGGRGATRVARAGGRAGVSGGRGRR
jgi:hypothetical protein